MSDYEYVGCFFDYNELSEKVKHLRQMPLKIEKTKPHITFEYKPSCVDTKLFGTKICVEIIGYGNNGENEGVLVIPKCDNEEISKVLSTIKTPHITLSVSECGKPVNTRYLTFNAVEPIHIVGYYDGHIDIEV